MSQGITAKKIAEYFLTKHEMTQKKIQKLVFYAYVWYIVDNNNDVNNIKNFLFDEKPQAWVHGPVFPSLYEEYRIHGRDDIPKIDCVIAGISDEIKKFLDEIWDIFGKYDGDELEILTHKEEPWIKARKNIAATAPSNEEINHVDIYNYYSSLED